MAFTKNPTPPDQRFDAMVEKTESGCWLWKGTRDPKGYGVFGVNNKEFWRAHRYSYTRHIGPIPEGLQLDHLCRVRNCVNPSHLEPVTNRENVIRGNAARPKATHCQKGHPFEDNTYINPRGRRECRACRRDATTRQRLRSQQ